MAIPTLDTPDDSSVDAKYYLLKINQKSNLGSRDADGSVIEYFDEADIGVIQSTSFAQELDRSEFRLGATSPNVPWVALLATLTKTFVRSSFSLTVNWTVGANDKETERNLAQDVIGNWNVVVNVGKNKTFSKMFWSYVLNDFCKIANPSFQAGSADDVFAFFKDIVDGNKSYVSETSGSVIFETRKEQAEFGINLGSFVDVFNDIIGDTEGRKQAAIEDNFHNFGRVKEDFQTLRNQVIQTIGNVFLGEDRDGDGAIDTDILKELKEQTDTPHMISGIRQNYFLIRSLSGNLALMNFSGLSDTPTGYESGKYLFSTASGIEYRNIDLGTVSLTGLSDTPDVYESGKYLVSTETGIEYRDIELGAVSLTGLSDTPDGYDEGKFLRSTDNGVEYVDISGQVPVSFLDDIIDKPTTEVVGGYLKLDTDGKLVWSSATTEGDIAYTITGATHITGLLDTPDGYDEGKFLRSTDNGVEYVDISGQVPVSFLDDIIDKPTTEVVGGYLKLDTDGKLVWSPATTEGDIAYTITGATHITGLLDTPDGYDEGKFLRSTSNGVEYVDISGQVTVSFLDDIIDKPTTEVVGGYLKLDTDGKLVWSPATTEGDIAYTITGATHITGLLDTPDGYDEGKFLRSTDNGVEYVDISGQVPVSFLDDIIDKPTTEVVGGYLKLDTDGKLVWSPATTEGDIAYTITGATHITGLLDTPDGYDEGKFLRSTSNGVEYVDISGQVPVTFEEIIGTPDQYQSGKYLVSTETGIEYRDIELGAVSLTGLSDTPDGYDEGKFLRSTDNGVEYVDISGQISSQQINWIAYPLVSDLPSASEHHGMFAHVHGEGSAYMAHAGSWNKIYPASESENINSLTGLSDTPAVYESGKYLVSTETGIEYRDIDLGATSLTGLSFTGFSDTPAVYESGKYLVSTETGIEYRDIDLGATSLTGLSFTGFSDTPAVYESGKYLVSTETGIEYRDIDLGTTSLTGLSFTGFPDTPAVYESGKYLVSTETGIEYRDREYLGKDIPVYPNSYNDTDSLPPDPQNRDGELVKVGCELYLSCNGKWINTTSENLSVTSQLPGCINNLEEAVQYSEYKDKFLAENSSDSFAAGFDGGIEPLVIDVCMHIDSNNSIYDSDHSLKIVETSYKWGIFKNPQTINIEALTSSQNCTFSQWTSSSATFEDQNNSQTSLLIDTDTSITGSFFCFGSIDEPACEDIALHLQPAAGETIADESSNNHQVTIQGDTTVDNTATLFGGDTMNFDGAGDYLSVAHSDLFNFGSDDFTIEMWINFNSQPAYDSVVMSHGDSGTNFNDWGWMLWSTGPNSLSFFSSLVGEGSNWSGSLHIMDSINLHQWYHIAIVKKSGTVYTYVDGVLQNQRSHSASIKNVTQNLIIGRSNWSNRAEFDGYFQDIRISKKALYTTDFAPPSNLLTKICPK